MPRMQYFRSSNSRCGVHKAACKYTAQVQSARNGCFPLCNMDWWLLQTVFVKPLSIIRYGKQQTIVTQGKEIVTAVRAYRTALEIRLLLTCETKAPSRDNCETGMSFCKINSFPFFAHTIFALSYKEDATVCKSINLYSGCASSMRLRLLILLT